MRTGRPAPALLLKKTEREALEAWARQSGSSPALAQRARIVLLCAGGRGNSEIAAELCITSQTAGKWRLRFLAGRLDGLLDEGRAGTSRRLSEADVDRVLTLSLESAPNGAQWSTRSLAAAAGLSRASVHRIWRAFSIQPHRDAAIRLMRESLMTGRGT
ncbi:MAG TPA: helix-turn-helix domain-containing protein [Bryobacteraceae bacterium]|jgi:transposase